MTILQLSMLPERILPRITLPFYGPPGPSLFTNVNGIQGHADPPPPAAADVVGSE